MDGPWGRRALLSYVIAVCLVRRKKNDAFSAGASVATRFHLKLLPSSSGPIRWIPRLCCWQPPEVIKSSTRTVNVYRICYHFFVDSCGSESLQRYAPIIPARIYAQTALSHSTAHLFSQVQRSSPPTNTLRTSLQCPSNVTRVCAT